MVRVRGNSDKKKDVTGKKQENIFFYQKKATGRA